MLNFPDFLNWWTRTKIPAPTASGNNRIPRREFLKNSAAIAAAGLLIAPNNTNEPEERVQRLMTIDTYQDPVDGIARICKLYNINSSIIENKFESLQREVQAKLKKANLEKPKDQFETVAALWIIFDVVSSKMPYIKNPFEETTDIRSLVSAFKIAKSDCDTRAQIVASLNTRLGLGFDYHFVNSPRHGFGRVYFTNAANKPQDPVFWKDYINVETNTNAIGFFPSSNNYYQVNEKSKTPVPYLEDIPQAHQKIDCLLRLIIDPCIPYKTRIDISLDAKKLAEKMGLDYGTIIADFIHGAYGEQFKLFTGGTTQKPEDHNDEGRIELLRTLREFGPFIRNDQVNLARAELILLNGLGKIQELTQLATRYKKIFPEDKTINFYFQLGHAIQNKDQTKVDILRSIQDLEYLGEGFTKKIEETKSKIRRHERESILESTEDLPPNSELINWETGEKEPTKFEEYKLKRINEYLEEYPDDVRVLVARAKVNLAYGLRDDAIKDCERINELSPYETDGYSILARLALQEMQADTALQLIESGLKRQPCDPILMKLKADALLEFDLKEEALEAYRRAAYGSRQIKSFGEYANLSKDLGKQEQFNRDQRMLDPDGVAILERLMRETAPKLNPLPTPN